ncbi:MAG: monosaccharide transporter ATP-binding protein family [Pseudonocardiales bacterium]|nr:monosaccharide transporter ATP-binding protein family [Pseudonocardiales bacterium]
MVESDGRSAPLLLDEPDALSVENIQKIYGGETALGGVSLSIRAGEIHGLLGANGAGKSTLVRIVCGVEAPDGGRVHMFGQELPRIGAAAAARALGLAYIHQDRALAPDLSVADNIAMATGYPTRWGIISRRAVDRVAAQALSQVGLDVDVRAQVSELTVGQQTLVAIARALAVRARLIILDEPTANLGLPESEMLYNRLQELSGTGVSSVLVTHALDEAIKVCHRVTVLRNGTTVATGLNTVGLGTEALATMIAGRPVARATRPSLHAATTRSVRLSLINVSAERFGPLSLSVRAGEIVGVTGLADSGHLQLGRLLIGEIPFHAGTIQLDEQDVRLASVREAIQRGVGYVPPDRVRDGLAIDLTSRENLFLDGRAWSADEANADAPVTARGRNYSAARETALARKILAITKTKPADPNATMSTLSGGNMQKVLVSKWLSRPLKVLVLSEPTVGVDVGAREDIYRAIADAAGRGLAIVVTSSDFEEIEKLCHRAVVLRYGRQVDELSQDRLTTEKLLARSSGGA